MTEPFLSIRKLRKAFGAFTAVHDVTLDIPKGEFLTFLGPSGSGKSTTLYAIAGFQDPTSGEVQLQGKSLLSVPSHKRNIGMVFQRYTLFPHLCVADNIAFPLKVRRRPKAEIDAKVAAMLKLVRLDRYAERMPAQLSGGQQQRVALARALAYDPPLLLMDEPLSALDKKLREEIQFEIKRIHNETGVTVLYVTHDQEEALRLSDRVARFNQGRIEQVGSGRDLYETPATHFVAGFIGDSNFLPGRITKAVGTTVEAVLPDGTLVGDLHRPGLKSGDAVSIMIRPDQLKIVRQGAAGTAPQLPVSVVDTTFLGSIIHILVKTRWGDEVALRSPADSLKEGIPIRGDDIALGWSPATGKVFQAC